MPGTLHELTFEQGNKMEQAIPDQDVDLLRLAAKAAGITIDFPCGMYDPMLVVKDEFGNYR